jgi:hypothetical protein
MATHSCIDHHSDFAITKPLPHTYLGGNNFFLLLYHIAVVQYNPVQKFAIPGASRPCYLSLDQNPIVQRSNISGAMPYALTNDLT